MIGVSYDPPQVLHEFATSKGIRFPLLADVSFTFGHMTTCLLQMRGQEMTVHGRRCGYWVSGPSLRSSIRLAVAMALRLATMSQSVFSTSCLVLAHRFDASAASSAVSPSSICA